MSVGLNQSLTICLTLGSIGAITPLCPPPPPLSYASGCSFTHRPTLHNVLDLVALLALWNAHFELRSVHMIEVLAYFELRIIHTSDRKYDSPFESVEKRHGCVWVACQSNMHVCCLRFLCMCSARYYRWKWLEGHTSSAPKNTILRSSHSYTDFVPWFARIVTGKHLCTVIWDAHFKLRFATWFGIHTVFFAYFEF